MQIQVVGLNHARAPIAIREQVGFTSDMLAEAYRQADRLSHQEGLVVLSTCNRTEIYVAGPVALADILAWWERMTGIDRGDFSDYLYWHQGSEAIRHLLRVATGLDSMVLGETQILGQVKDAYQKSQEYGQAGRLHRIFHYALRSGKRAHAETGIDHNALSMGHAVIELIKKVFGELDGITALVVGSGDMGRLVARHLAAQGPRRLMIANRTREKAHVLAQDVGGEVADFSALASAIREADVIVSATSAPAPVISYAMARTALRGQGQRLRFFFDLAVPRDVEDRVATLGSGVFLYDVDDVKGVVESNLAQRQREVVKVERIIREEEEALMEELGASQVGPVIQRLRAKAEAIRQRELEKAMTRLPDLTAQERLVVEDTTRLILNKFLNDAMVSMRQWGADDGKASYIEAIRDLFRLDEDGTGGGERVNREVAIERE